MSVNIQRLSREESIILYDLSTVSINRLTNSHDHRYISIGLRLLRPIDRIRFLFTVPVHLSTASAAAWCNLEGSLQRVAI